MNPDCDIEKISIVLFFQYQPTTKKLSVRLFYMPYNLSKPQKGSLLISEPTLQDNYFNRAVILLTEHNQEGTVGFILNKPLDIELNTLVSDMDECKANVFFGGPVNRDNLFYIHTLGKAIEGAMTITDNLFWGGDFTMLKDLLRKDETKLNEVRFFVGYAGWDQGQLEHELELNSWVVKSLTDADILKQQPQHLWKNTLRKMGSDIALLSFFPDNPQLN